MNFLEKSAATTVLVVESETGRANHLLDLLSDMGPSGSSVSLVSTLSEALLRIDEGEIDAIVTRLKLPDTRGLETLIRIRERREDCPVIALLEDGEKELVLDAAQSLSDDCLFYGDLNRENLQQSLSISLDRKEMLRDLKRRQEHLKVGRGMYRPLLDQLDQAVFLVSRQDGSLLYCNEVAKAWFSNDTERLLHEIFEYGILDGAELELEIETQYPRIPNAELKAVSIEWEGQQCSLFSLRDISKRKRAEAAYRSSRRRLDLALKASNIGMWSWDLRAHQLQYSERWKAQLGFRNHEFPNTLSAFRNGLHPDDKEKAIATFRSMLKGDKKDFELSYRMRHKSGSYRWILCRAEVFPDNEGQLALVLGTHIDVTERRTEQSYPEREPRTSLQATQSEVEARLQSRLESYASLLAAEAQEVSSHFRSDSHIGSRFQNIQSLSSRIKILNRILQSGNDSRLEVGEGELGFAEELQELLPQGVELWGDVVEVAGALQVNIKDWWLFLAECILIVSDHVTPDFRSSVSLELGSVKDETVQVRIRYEGTAILEHELQSLSEMSGMSVSFAEIGGLSSVRIDLGKGGSEGSVKAETFDQARDSEKEESGKKRLALLAEDEEVLSLAIQSMLESLGFEVVAAFDGAEAIDRFFQDAAGYELALIDLHMPEIDGDSVANSVRETRPDLPIVLMSGDDQDSIEEAFGTSDANSYFLAKPFGIADLKRAVNDLVRSRACR